MSELIDQFEREQAIRMDRNVLVQAPAGSGKTSLLIQRALAALATVQRPEEVLSITFTNKAANELRVRLMEALALGEGDKPENDHEARTWALARAVLDRDKALGWGLRTNPARLRAMTIDSLNAALAAQLPLLSGVGGHANVNDRPERLYRRAVEALFTDFENDALDPADRQSLARVIEWANNRIDKLLPFMAQMLGQRDQWLYEFGAIARDPEAIEQASQAMDESLQGLAQEAVDELVVALGMSNLERLVDLVGRGSYREKLAWAKDLSGVPGIDEEGLAHWRGLVDVLFKQDGGWRSKLTAREGFPAKEDDAGAANALLIELKECEAAERIQAAAAAVRELPPTVVPEDARELRAAFMRVMVQVYVHLLLVFQQEGELDFGEVAARALRALTDADGVAEVLERQDMAIEHILLDEAQDTSLSQYRLLECLTSGWEAGDGRTLCIVGDPQQSIYVFREADVRLFMQLAETGTFNDLALEVLQLRTNFRSAPELIDDLNETFDCVFPARNEADVGVVAFTRSSAAKEPGTGETAHFHAVPADDAGAEARQAVSVIQQRLAADPDVEVGVLCRARRHVREVVAELKRQEVPFSSQEIDSLAANEAVADYLAVIRALWHVGERGAWVTLLRAPFVGLSHEDLTAVLGGRHTVSVPECLAHADADKLSDEGRARLARFQAVYRGVMDDPILRADLPRRVWALWCGLGGPACVSAQGLREVRRVQELLLEHVVGGTLESHEDFESAVSSLYANTQHGRVHVMTVHKSKGLEFDAVVLVGAGRPRRQPDRPLMAKAKSGHGLVVAPNPGAGADKAMPARRLFDYVIRHNARLQENEELRLLYVACTRAKAWLDVFVQVDRNGQPGIGSFGALLWPAIEDRLDAEQALEVDEAWEEARPEPDVPRIPRLPVDWQPKVETPRFVAAQRQRVVPSGLVATHRDVATGEADDFVEAMIGSVFHRVLESVFSASLPEQRLTEVLDRPMCLPPMMRRLGVPQTRVDEACETVVELLRVFQASEDAAWLLHHAQSATPEYHYGGYSGQRWRAGRVDLLLDLPNEVVVVDYKAGHREMARHSEHSYASALRKRYGRSMAEYVTVIGQRADGKPVRGLLYGAASGRLYAVCESLEPESA